MSAFMLTRHIWDTVGEFDPNFRKAFFEDNDYKYRVKLAGFTVRYEDELNADVYKNSQTIEKDPLLGGYIENREYYINKWGGLPDEEQYKTPFNAQ
jgi:GT2 family glycosyltransferase